MASSTTYEYSPDSVSPPGEILAEVLEANALTQSNLAVRMDRPEKTISEIIHGKTGISTDTAAQLELVLGIPATFWLNLDTNYRAYLSRKDEAERLATHLTWAKRFDYRALAKHGWVADTKDKVKRVRELLSFFGVASPAAFDEQLAMRQAVFRRSDKYEADTLALAAWLRQGERQAQKILCAPYDEGRFLGALEALRPVTRERDPALFVPELESKCAACGVAVVFVPQVPKCRASGAARWLSSSRALIQLSLRYKTNDHLWFSFYHEAKHVLAHPKRQVFLEGRQVAAVDPQQESEADEFAANTLIPPAEYGSFTCDGTRRAYSKDQIVEFADAIDIAAGIVVGRLQHDGLLSHGHCNGLKVRYDWGKPRGGQQ